MVKNNFTPSFKEKDSEQFAYTNAFWIKCNEATINSLWHIWVSSVGSHRYYDEEGFLVFGFVSHKKNDEIDFCIKETKECTKALTIQLVIICKHKSNMHKMKG